MVIEDKVAIKQSTHHETKTLNVYLKQHNLLVGQVEGVFTKLSWQRQLCVLNHIVTAFIHYFDCLDPFIIRNIMETSHDAVYMMAAIFANLF